MSFRSVATEVTDSYYTENVLSSVVFCCCRR